MPVIDVHGLQVQFPYEPYALQKTYIGKVVECLNTKNNAVLESPSGSGKTLSLLCPILSWMKTNKAKFKQCKVSPSRRFHDSLAYRYAANLYIPPRERAMFEEVRTNAKVKIIYASSSYSLLSKAKQQLEKLNLPVHAVVLGSRDQLCINTDVANVTGGHATKASICQQKVKSQICGFYNRVERTRNGPLLRDTSILDIEDLVTVGKKLDACPYYISKNWIQCGNVLFLTHEYLFDSLSRKADGLDIRNNIVVLDEGHNVAKICADSYSTRIRSSEVALAISEITYLIENGLIDSEDFSMFFDSNEGIELLPDDMLMMKEVLVKLDKLIKAILIIPLPKGDIREGTYIFNVLEEANLTFDNIDEKLELLVKITTHFNVVQENGDFEQRAVGLQALVDFLKIVYASSGDVYYKSVELNFRVYIEDEEQDNENQSSTAEGKDVDREMNPKVLNFMCVNPGYAIRQLMNAEPRNIILTSSTLAPLRPLIDELRLPVTITLENPHFVDRSKLCVKVISHGPDRVELFSRYLNCTNLSYITSIGRTLLSVCPVIPGGLVLFSPSNQFLNVCTEAWKTNGIWTQITQIKPIFIEPPWADKKSYATKLKEYYTSLRQPGNRGAIFMAVCPGPISERFNFSGVNCRAALIIGVPFPNRTDTRVILRKDYLNITSTKKIQPLSGNAWYDLEAFRAVNQAIRRIVRHKDDYGAILLCDTRYELPCHQAKLSSWMQSYLRNDCPTDRSNPSKFGKVIGALANFYRAHRISSDDTANKRDVRKIREERENRVTNSYNNYCSEFRLSDYLNPPQTSNYEPHFKTAREVFRELNMNERQTSTRSESSLVTVTSTSNHCRLKNIETVSNKADVNDPMVTQKQPLIRPETSRKKNGNTSPVSKKQKAILHDSTNSQATRIRPIDNKYYRKNSSMVFQQKTNSSPAQKAPECPAELVQLVKKSLSSETYKLFLASVRRYQNDGDFTAFIAKLCIFFKAPHQRYLLKGMQRFLKSEHKQQLDEFLEKGET